MDEGRKQLGPPRLRKSVVFLYFSCVSPLPFPLYRRRNNERRLECFIDSTTRVRHGRKKAPSTFLSTHTKLQKEGECTHSSVIQKLTNNRTYTHTGKNAFFPPCLLSARRRQYPLNRSQLFGVHGRQPHQESSLTLFVERQRFVFVSYCANRRVTVEVRK
jgi:hypothetical protein